MESYLGRWYQVAGTPARFTQACTGGCIYAEYGLNADGTVAVTNGCQRATPGGPVPVTINGTATPVARAYGAEGVFRVEFPFPAAGGDAGQSNSTEGECPGPNYIVQAYDGLRGWAVVQASNFSELFLLSREQSRTEREIERWLGVAEELGSDLGEVVRFNQTGCAFT